jgi:DNA end-binding protein Ku
LEEKKKAGIGKVTIRTREHLAAVHPQGRVLAMQILFYADEVRSVDTVPDLPHRIAIHANEERMASQLIEAMTMDFDPTQYRSEYKQALKRLVKAKLEGTQLPPPKAGARVIDLQEALRASLKKSRAGRRAGTRAAS